MCSLGDIRRLVQERGETVQILEWLRRSPLRTATWLETALQRRLNILQLEYPELPKPDDFKQVLILLEQYYLKLEDELLLRLPVVEQLYYNKILNNWRDVTRLLFDNGVSIVNRKYGKNGEPSIVVYLSCSKQQFVERMEELWDFCEWSECKSLFNINSS